MYTVNPDDYQVELSPLSEADGGSFLAVVPGLAGCMSDGETRTEAVRKVREAIVSWLETADTLGRDNG